MSDKEKFERTKPVVNVEIMGGVGRDKSIMSEVLAAALANVGKVDSVTIQTTIIYPISRINKKTIYRG